MLLQNILKASQQEFYRFAEGVCDLSNIMSSDRFTDPLDFDAPLAARWSSDLIFESIAATIAVHPPVGYDVRRAVAEEYSCVVDVWTKRAKEGKQRKYRLESDVYIVSFPIGLYHHHLVESSDNDVLCSNVRRTGSLSGFNRVVKALRIIEHIRDYDKALENVKAGMVSVKGTYEKIKLSDH